MKRAGRWLFNFEAAVSVLIWLTAMVAWPLSHWRVVSVRRYTASSFTAVTMDAGRMRVERFACSQAGAQTLYEWDAWSARSAASAVKNVTKRYETLGKRSPELLRFEDLFGPSELSIPFWALLLIFAWPIIPWIRRRRRSALPPHHYKQCGYDLRTTPDRCPECGTPVIVPAKA